MKIIRKLALAAARWGHGPGRGWNYGSLGRHLDHITMALAPPVQCLLEGQPG